jgi:hypothetical protein
VAPTSAPALTRISSFFGHFRWLFMPLGLVALIAVGVHAAADTVDDRLLWLVQALDAWMDGHFARVEALQSWVDRFGSREQTLVARALTLVWELIADVILAVPLIGYAESNPSAFKKETWRTLLQRVNQQPTPMRLIRPIVTAIFALAGAYAIARMVDGALFISLRAGVAPDALAQPLARAIAFLAFLHVSIAFGWRAVLRALQHADAACTPVAVAATAAERLALLSGQKKPSHVRGPWTVGLIGSAIAAPLALAALLDALPLLSFFR